MRADFPKRNMLERLIQENRHLCVVRFGSGTAEELSFRRTIERTGGMRTSRASFHPHVSTLLNAHPAHAVLCSTLAKHLAITPLVSV